MSSLSGPSDDTEGFAEASARLTAIMREHDAAVAKIAEASVGRTYRDVVIEALRNPYDDDAWSFVSQEFWSDREIVLAAVNRKGGTLCRATEELRADREVVLAAVNNDGEAFLYAAEEFRSDRDVILVAASTYGMALRLASQEITSDREVVLVAVNSSGVALQFASEELRSDREVVLTAVRIHGRALLFSSDELRSDGEVVLVAMQAINCDTNVLGYTTGDLLDCATNASIQFVQTALQVLLSSSGRCSFHQLWSFFPRLRSILIALFLQLKGAGYDSSSCGDVTAEVFAQQWIAVVTERQWCLNWACRDASVSIDIKRKIEQFASFAEDFETANQLLTFSDIFCLCLRFDGSKICSNWWELLQFVEDDEA